MSDAPNTAPAQRPPRTAQLLRAGACMAALCMGAACQQPGPQSTAPANEATPTVAKQAPADLQGLEAWFRSAQRLNCSGTVTAEGAVTAKLSVTLQYNEDLFQLSGQGNFAGQDVDLEMRRSGGAVPDFTVNASHAFSAPPASLEDAVFVGLVRMGVLHNLARLTGNQAPDHAEGGVQDWVSAGAEQAVQAEGQTTMRSFKVVVAGEDSGEALLAWALATQQGNNTAELALQRTQVVSFPEGEMRVREQLDCQADAPGEPANDG